MEIHCLITEQPVMASFMFLVLSYLFELLRVPARNLTRLLWENELSVSTVGARNGSTPQKQHQLPFGLEIP